MSAPTPGSWRLEQNSAGQWCVIGAGELVVCMFPPLVAEIADEQMANMRAIAAAELVLAAAQAAWNCIAQLPPTQARVEVAVMLQSAIEQATGITE